jgi:hypothetical protein
MIIDNRQRKLLNYDKALKKLRYLFNSKTKSLGIKYKGDIGFIIKNMDFVNDHGIVSKETVRQLTATGLITKCLILQNKETKKYKIDTTYHSFLYRQMEEDIFTPIFTESKLIKIPKNVDILNYFNKKKKEVWIDEILIEEIKGLWELNIRTLSCCCGHGVQPSSIIVELEDIGKMKYLGYTEQIHFLDSSRKGFFLSKINLLNKLNGGADNK